MDDLSARPTGAQENFRDPYDFPRRWEADVVLSDGGTVHLRPITPDDADALLAFHSRLSEPA